MSRQSLSPTGGLPPTDKWRRATRIRHDGQVIFCSGQPEPGQMYRGFITKFDQATGSGFILMGSDEVFFVRDNVHQNSRKRLAVGARVKFLLVKASGSQLHHLEAKAVYVIAPRHVINKDPGCRLVILDLDFRNIEKEFDPEYVPIS